MCTIFYKPAWATLSEDWIVRAAVANPDGFGLVSKDRTDALYVVKGIMSIEEMLHHVNGNRNNEAILHFRWATHGAVNDANCHPFPVHGGSWLAHNGIFRGFGSPSLSDTRDWIDRVLNKVLRRGKDPRALNIGYNKAVIMHPGSDRTTILGEDFGIWENGVWYSNLEFLRANQKQGWQAPKDTLQELILKGEMALQDMQFMADAGDPQLGIDTMEEMLEYLKTIEEVS